MRLTLKDGAAGDMAKYLNGTGQHVDIAAEVEGVHKERPYTPFVIPHKPGGPHVFEVVVKAYPERPGALSPRILECAVGDSIEMRAGQYPSGTDLHGVKQLGMVAAGTGITPMLQILYNLLDLKQRGVGPPMPNCSVVVANHTIEDIIMQSELAAIAEAHKEVQIHHVISEQADMEDSMSHGHVNAAILSQLLAAPGPRAKVLVCGPPGFHLAVCAALDGHDIHEFK